jgi:hypothetical protein
MGHSANSLSVFRQYRYRDTVTTPTPLIAHSFPGAGTPPACAYSPPALIDNEHVTMTAKVATHDRYVARRGTPPAARLPHTGILTTTTSRSRSIQEAQIYCPIPRRPHPKHPHQTCLATSLAVAIDFQRPMLPGTTTTKTTSSLKLTEFERRQ